MKRTSYTKSNLIKLLQLPHKTHRLQPKLHTHKLPNRFLALNVCVCVGFLPLVFYYLRYMSRIIAGMTVLHCLSRENTVFNWIRQCFLYIYLHLVVSQQVDQTEWISENKKQNKSKQQINWIITDEEILTIDYIGFLYFCFEFPLQCNFLVIVFFIFLSSFFRTELFKVHNRNTGNNIYVWKITDTHKFTLNVNQKEFFHEKIKNPTVETKQRFKDHHFLYTFRLFFLSIRSKFCVWCRNMRQ